jgi:hypothetical protein
MPGERDLSFTQVRSKMALHLSLETGEGRANSLLVGRSRAAGSGVTYNVKFVKSGACGRLVLPLLNGGSGFKVSFLP